MITEGCCLLEGNHALQQGDGETALVNIATAISLNPRLGDAHATLEKILEACGLAQSATAVARRLHLLRLSNKASRLMRHRVTTRPGQENDEASGGESRATKRRRLVPHDDRVSGSDRRPGKVAALSPQIQSAIAAGDRANLLC
jgi:hypothetical protein